MSGWTTAPISRCAQIVSGATPKTWEPAYWDGDICWATPKDLSELDGAYISDTARKITRSGIESCAAAILPANSVLFSSRAPIGHVAINTVPMATNQGFKSFVPIRDRLDPKFLYYWLKMNRSYLEALGNGATFKEVSKAVVSRIEIPLPPLPDQLRIVAILDKADEVRTERRRTVAQIGTLTQAIFLEMFGDPATNPKAWPRVALGALSSKFSDGPFGSNLKSSDYTDTGVRVVRLQNIGIGELLDDDKAYVSEEHFAGLRKHECRPGDVLIATLGDPNLRACIQPDSLSIALNKADCVQLRPDLAIANAQYVCALLNQPSTERMAHDLILGQTRLRISMGRLRGLEVPKPPLALQNDFAERVAAVERHKAVSHASAGELNALFDSLRFRAFRAAL